MAESCDVVDSFRSGVCVGNSHADEEVHERLVGGVGRVRIVRVGWPMLTH
jgi:hypothetical protein